MKINLNDFVGKRDPRAWMREPIQVLGKLAATDGRAMFISNTDSDLPSPETTSLERIERYLSIARSSDFYPAPEFIFPEMPRCIDCGGSGKRELQTCPECEGFGDVELHSDYNSYEVFCKMCEGSGKVESKDPEGECGHCGGKGKRWSENDRMQVEGIPFDMNPGLMSRIAGVSNLEIAKINSDEIGRAMAFRCPDGVGIIMGMRDAR